MSCDEFEQISAELALGIADARQRASALRHAGRCPACRSELSAFADVADGLAALAPLAEPPAGFESRVVAGLVPASAGATRGPGWLRYAAAAVVAMAIGAGGWLVGDRGSSSRPAPAALTSPLVAGGHDVGEVVLYTGARPWLSMYVDTGWGDESVSCQVVTSGGSTVTVGAFELSSGDGYWATSVPVPGSSVRSARLVAGGQVVAEATLRS
jgi:hypothetical protein